MKRRGFVAVTVGAYVLRGVLMASAGLGVMVAALLWFVDPAGAIPLESWDDQIPLATNRFKVLTEFGGQAVLDRETQLVWERSPQTAPAKWSNARFDCTGKTVGNRKGWRLPSVHELASLVDPSVSPGPTLPPGHPFTNVQSDDYWSATTNAEFPDHAWEVLFGGGVVTATTKDDGDFVWCVRGGMNADAY